MTWHILLCEPQREKVAARRLSQLGFEPYVPVIPHIMTRSFRCMWGMHRKQYETVRPLFPGYLFLPLNGEDAGSIYTVDGLRHSNPFLVIDQCRAILREDDMATIKHLEKALRNPQVPGLPYAVGDRVRVLDGPFADRVAVISRLDDAERIELLMDLLGGKTKVLASAKQITID